VAQELPIDSADAVHEVVLVGVHVGSGHYSFINNLGSAAVFRVVHFCRRSLDDFVSIPQKFAPHRGPPEVSSKRQMENIMEAISIIFIGIIAQCSSVILASRDIGNHQAFRALDEAMREPVGELPRQSLIFWQSVVVDFALLSRFVPPILGFDDIVHGDLVQVEAKFCGDRRNIPENVSQLFGHQLGKLLMKRPVSEHLFVFRE
jgi:hypothetical protein